MRSHHRQVAILVPDDKLDCFGYSRKNLARTKTVKLFIQDQYCHLGLKAPHYAQSDVIAALDSSTYP